jgi:histone deacetylase 1/2
MLIDIIFTGTSSTEINNFIQRLGNVFLVKDLGILSYFLGVEALFDGPDLFLTQRKYEANLL